MGAKVGPLIQPTDENPSQTPPGVLDRDPHSRMRMATSSHWTHSLISQSFNDATLNKATSWQCKEEKDEISEIRSFLMHLQHVLFALAESCFVLSLFVAAEAQFDGTTMPSYISILGKARLRLW